MDTKKLRQKILDLAIRGKLVPQDPNDEPASVLLERIRAEKEQLIKEGKIKRSKKSAATDKSHYENVPFEIPGNWCWCKLSDVCNFESGYAFSSDDYKDKGTPLVRISNIQDGLVSLDNCVYIEGDIDKRFIINNGDLLIAMSGATTGKMGVYQYDCPALLNQRVGNIKVNTSLLLQKYRDYFMQSQGDLILKLSYGGAQPNVSAKIISDLFIPIPSLNEQEKIVAEIEKWFGFIDEIENGKIELESHIKKTKSKILDLAISGKLVPQDPNDEPAIELLKRINPGFKPCDNSHYENLPFEEPDGWCWATLGSIGKWQSGATPSRMRKDYYGGDIPWLKTGDLNDWYITDIPEYITQQALNETSVKLNPAGSILIAMYGATIGKIGILTMPATTNQACCACISHNGIEQMYLFYYLLSHKEEFVRQGGGGAQPNISKEKIVETLIPIPPLSEQLRIIKAIEAIFNQIDTITAELS